MALTEFEKQILRLSAEGFSDYRIARMLRVNICIIYRSHRNALKKIECAKADLTFTDELRLKS